MKFIKVLTQAKNKVLNVLMTNLYWVQVMFSLHIKVLVWGTSYSTYNYYPKCDHGHRPDQMLDII